MPNSKAGRDGSGPSGAATCAGRTGRQHVGVDVGGSADAQAAQVVEQLTWHSALAAPSHVRRPARLGFAKHSLRLLGFVGIDGVFGCV